ATMQQAVGGQNGQAKGTGRILAVQFNHFTFGMLLLDTLLPFISICLSHFFPLTPPCFFLPTSLLIREN
ncbi:hypothetical protein XENOCAPTIV_012283, partial [Xenoophorus captivus]